MSLLAKEYLLTPGDLVYDVISETGETVIFGSTKDRGEIAGEIIFDILLTKGVTKGSQAISKVNGKWIIKVDDASDLVNKIDDVSDVTNKVDDVVQGTTNGGILDNANYAQKTYNANNFSAEGIKKYSELAGKQIKSVDDLATAIRNGQINISDVPIEYIVRDGNILILNTRSSQALTQAGIARNQWNAVNRTGDAFF